MSVPKEEAPITFTMLFCFIVSVLMLVFLIFYYR